MFKRFLPVLAASCIGLFFVALPALAQDTMRIRGTVERIEGPVFVVKTRDGSEVKLTVTDNPLFVVIVPAKMGDIKPGMILVRHGLQGLRTGRPALGPNRYFDTANLSVRRAKKGSPATHPIRGDELRALRKLQREVSHYVHFEAWVAPHYCRLLRARSSGRA